MTSQFSIGICASRKLNLPSILQMIAHQDMWPKHIVIVSTFRVSPTLWLSNKDSELFQLSRYCKISLCITQKESVAHSRNVILKNTKTKWLIFLDDDVIITDTKLFSYILNRANTNKYIGVTPLVVPSYISSYSEFFFILYHYNVKSLKNVSLLKEHPLALMLVNQDFVRRHGIIFDEQLTSGEDIKFTREIAIKGGKIIIILNRLVFHVFEHSIIGFVKKCSWYCSGIIKTDSEDEMNFHGFLPRRIKHFLFYPIFVINQIFIGSRQIITDTVFPTDNKIIFPSILFYTILYVNILAMSTYRNKCKQVLFTTIKQRFIKFTQTLNIYN